MHLTDILSDFGVTPFLLALVLALVLLSQPRAKPLSAIPTSRLVEWLPFYRMAIIATGQSHLFELSLHKRFGSVVRLNDTAISVADPDIAYKFLRIDDIKKSRFYERLRRNNDPPNLVTHRDPVEHKAMRHLVSPAFSIRYLAGLEPLMGELIEELEKSLGSSPRVDMGRVYHLFAMDFISKAAFGQSLHAVVNGTHPFIANLKSGLLWAVVGLAFPFIPTHKFPAVKRLRQSNDSIIDSFIFDRRKMNEEGKRRDDILQVLMDQNLDHLPLRTNLRVFFTAGSETTANTLTWATYMLLRNPQTLERLRQELDSAFPDGLRVVLPVSALKTLPYLNAVIKETLRLRPVAATVSREIEEDTTITGHRVDGTPVVYHVPGGTHVDVSICALQRNPQIWIRPDDFWPERWLAEISGDEEAWGVGSEGKGDEKHSERFVYGTPKVVCREAYIPFSMGSRDCIGRNLAWNELRVVLAHVVRRYDITAEFDTSLDLQGKEYVTVGLGSKTGLPVKLHRRQ
ncbi:cytochrome P450 [Gonapodya prolifera JEL478]|uniref:Cytochrome P450 n=1 Tax=Gonapodya prolifera (strain JEL478) TaxID=1344416 RepID=A0A139A9F5_GONPJ|nr:cytochrome P450 [Gonapodya prolifera JEL478]|eukprot:KXS13314.1 cytochrome P450 [Gonapodya prolifera JEL478]